MCPEDMETSDFLPGLILCLFIRLVLIYILYNKTVIISIVLS